MFLDGDDEKLRVWLDETEMLLGKLGLAGDWVPPNKCRDIIETRAAGLDIGSRRWGISPTTATAALRNVIE